jgi:hypothetical protein
MRRFGVVITAALLLVVLVAPAGNAATKKKGAPVKIKLFEFGVRSSLPFVAEGKVTFGVKNIGTEEHEFVVVRVDPDTELPTKADGSVDEEAIPESDGIGELEGIKPKKTKSLTKKLDADDYVLFCNIVEDEDGTTVSHYAEGMHRNFTVG